MMKPFKIEPKSFIIKDHASTVFVQSYLMKHLQIAIDQGKPLVVYISQEDVRTKAQNDLLHMWFDQISKHTGDSPERVKYLMKYKFLAMDCVRSDKAAAEAYDAIIGYRDVLPMLEGELKKEHTTKYHQLQKRFIQDYVKSSKLNKKRFSRFCDKIHNFANVELGVYLKVPDDLMYALEMKQ